MTNPTLQNLGITLTLEESKLAAAAVNAFGEGCHLCAQAEDYENEYCRVSRFSAAYVRDCLYTALGRIPEGHQAMKTLTEVFLELQLVVGGKPEMIVQPEMMEAA